MCSSVQVGGKKRELVRSRCDLDKMCTASIMFSPPSSSSLTFMVASTPRQERRHGDLDEDHFQTSRSAFTQYQTPRRTPATSLILRSITPSSRSRSLGLVSNRSRALLGDSPRLEKPIERFDLLVYLPVEVAVIILEYLRPKDLCQVCQVSRDWYRLSKHPPLHKQRVGYVKALREEYQLSKENFPLPALRDNGTPQQPSFVPTRHMTVSQSPLNVIQPKSSVSRSSNRQTNHHTSSMSPPQGSGQTPCPLYLLETVQRLSLDDGTGEVRRCLFPRADSPPSHSHKSLATRPAWNQKTSYKCCTKELMAGKKTNRSRLRRL